MVGYHFTDAFDKGFVRRYTVFSRMQIVRFYAAIGLLKIV